MLLLNTDLWHYWPTVFFIGAFTFVTFLVAVFLYVDHKDLQKEKAKEAELLRDSILTIIEPRKKFWERFKEWLGITKKESKEEEEEDYKDRYGTFQSVGLILVVVGIIYLIGEINFDVSLPKINLPSWINNVLSNLWFWIGLLVVILLIAFRKKVPGKSSWKWLWSIPIVILTAWGVWLIYSTLVAPFVVSKYAERNPGPSPTVYKSDPLIGSPSFNKNGKNYMKKGEVFQMTLQRDDPEIFLYPPKDGTPAVLEFQLAGRPHRWTMILWWENDVLKWSYPKGQPVDEIMFGRLYVSCKNRSVELTAEEK